MEGMTWNDLASSGPFSRVHTQTRTIHDSVAFQRFVQEFPDSPSRRAIAETVLQMFANGESWVVLTEGYMDSAKTTLLYDNHSNPRAFLSEVTSVTLQQLVEIGPTTASDVLVYLANASGNEHLDVKTVSLSWCTALGIPNLVEGARTNIVGGSVYRIEIATIICRLIDKSPEEEKARYAQQFLEYTTELRQELEALEPQQESLESDILDYIAEFDDVVHATTEEDVGQADFGEAFDYSTYEGDNGTQEGDGGRKNVEGNHVENHHEDQIPRSES